LTTVKNLKQKTPNKQFGLILILHFSITFSINTLPRINLRKVAFVLLAGVTARDFVFMGDERCICMTTM